MVVFLYGWNFPRHRLTSNVFLFSLPQHRGFNGVFKKLRLCRHGTLGPVSGGVRGYPPDNDPTLVFDGIDRLHRRPEGIIFVFSGQLLLYFPTTFIIFSLTNYYFFTDIICRWCLSPLPAPCAPRCSKWWTTLWWRCDRSTPSMAKWWPWFVCTKVRWKNKNLFVLFLQAILFVHVYGVMVFIFRVWWCTFITNTTNICTSCRFTSNCFVQLFHTGLF